MSDMGERIRQKRIEQGLSLEELGKMLGVQKTAVSKWELGAVENIKRNTIEQMANIFKCSPAWLMGFDDKEEREPAWMAAFSGAGYIDPRVTDFLAYLNEKRDTTKLTPEENDVLVAYRAADERTRQIVDFALGLKGE